MNIGGAENSGVLLVVLAAWALIWLIGKEMLVHFTMPPIVAKVLTVMAFIITVVIFVVALRLR